MTETATTTAPEWAPNLDPRSLDYPVSAIVAPGQRRRVMWDLPVLDQGADGACVGYAIASAAGDPQSAEKVYAIAKTLDQWPGEAYSGTSVTAGAQAGKALGIIESYRWAYDVPTILDALAVGPVALGLYWTPGMFKPAGGIMRVDAPKHQSLGHCAVAVGYDPEQDAIRMQSSWGTRWADAGRAWLPLGALATLMGRTGEACLVVPA
jgi:hypothetical protein